jgi:hypothetical protein
MSRPVSHRIECMDGFSDGVVDPVVADLRGKTTAATSSRKTTSVMPNLGLPERTVARA